MGSLRPAVLACALAACAALLGPATAGAEVTSVFEGEVACSALPSGVRFCGSTEPRSTAKSFDLTPIDVNFALPASGSGPFPTVMLFHGYGGSKLGLSDMQPWLDRGYAAFSMTDRGFHESCGTTAAQEAAPAGACADGYIHLMDDRVEVRDAQYLAGRLVDEGLVAPTKLAAVGGSYGGGMSMALAALRNRTMMPDGSLVPWASPHGVPMELAAAAPNIPWTDLAASLVPNGSTLDYVADAPYKGRIGVEKQSLVAGLYVNGCSAGFCAPAGLDPTADLAGWKAMLDAGEPYDTNPMAQALVSQVTTFHSSYYIDHSEPPAPMLISNGFTDDLFPVDEALRFYNRTRGQYSPQQAPISMFFGDFGHPRAQNKADVTAALEARVLEWIGYYVKGEGQVPFQGVETMTLTCPKTAPSGGPYYSGSWSTIAPGEVRLEDKRTRTIQAGSGENGTIFDPAFGKGACATAPAADDPGAATYRLPAAPAGGYTLMGSPTVIADFLEQDPNSQVAARLLDVAPDETETLVARGLWRPALGSKGSQVFQLHADGYHFEAGHIAKLELIAADSPYGRVSNGQQPIAVSNLQLRLPVLEKPGTAKGFVKAPAPKVVPKGYELASDFKLLDYPAPKALKQVRLKGRRLLVQVQCPHAWAGCDQLVVTVHGSGKGAKRLLGSARVARIGGGKKKVVSVRLRGSASRYLASLKRKPRVRVTLRTAERLEPTIVARPLKRPKS